MADALPGGGDLLVVDHYGRDRAFESACRSFASRIMAIEDQPRRRHDCDVLLDPTPGRRVTDYRQLVPEGCRLLLGPSYALLRGQFAQKREKALAARARRERAERLFVSLGMTDPRNLTAAVLQGIAESGTGLAIDLVIGSAAPHLSDLRRLIIALDLDVRLHVDTDDVAALMAEADLAIGAAGSSSFERCCLGLPSLIVVAADNQRDIAATLLASGAVEEVGQAGLSNGIAEALRRLCTDRKARAAMAEAAAKLCDGRGAYRVAEALSAPRASVSRQPRREKTS